MPEKKGYFSRQASIRTLTLGCPTRCSKVSGLALLSPARIRFMCGTVHGFLGKYRSRQTGREITFDLVADRLSDASFEAKTNVCYSEIVF